MPYLQGRINMRAAGDAGKLDLEIPLVVMKRNQFFIYFHRHGLIEGRQLDRFRIRW